MLLKNKARPERFELPTLWFEDRGKALLKLIEPYGFYPLSVEAVAAGLLVFVEPFGCWRRSQLRYRLQRSTRRTKSSLRPRCRSWSASILIEVWDLRPPARPRTSFFPSLTMRPDGDGARFRGDANLKTPQPDASVPRMRSHFRASSRSRWLRQCSFGSPASYRSFRPAMPNAYM
jgi:hypothetical protein